MADGAAAPAAGAVPTSAPAGGASSAPAGSADTAAAKALEASATGAKPAGGEPAAWGDEDDAQFFELAKRSPYRAKMKGEERVIDSKESLRDLLNHAQRGIGASKLVEEAKKEAETAKQEREEAAKERALVARAKKGDFEARKALGLVSPDEVRKRDADWEAVPPEVRELHAGYTQAQKKLAEYEAKENARQAEETQRREQTELAAAKRVATNATHEVLTKLGLTETNAERFLPHVAGAIVDLGAEGLELGVDMPAELIVERVKQRIGAMDEEHFGGLNDERAFALMVPRLSKMDDAGLDKALPAELQRRIAKKVALEVRGKRAAQQGGGSLTRIDRKDEPREEPPKVLSPIRFPRR